MSRSLLALVSALNLIWFAVPASAEPPMLKKAPDKAVREKGALAVQLPQTPVEREKALANLYAHLATAESADAAKPVAAAIEKLWNHSGSDTVGVLMDRAGKAATAKNTDLAIKLLDTVVDLAPDYTEGWSHRAFLHFQRNDVQRALGDLRRVLALDASHFRALEGLGQILKEIGQKPAALKALKQLLEVHPYWDGAKQAVDELSREVEGQRL